MSSFLKSLDDETAYLEAGLERTRAEIERNQAELERIQKRLAANREERRRVEQPQSSRPRSLAAIIASNAAAAAAAAAARPKKKPKRKEREFSPPRKYPDYNFLLSVDGDWLKTEEMCGGSFVIETIKRKFNHEVDDRPEKYHEMLYNPAGHNYGHPRYCLNDESPIQDQEVACRWCTEHKMPCMRRSWDENFGLTLIAAPLASSLREGREWNELEYWMLP